MKIFLNNCLLIEYHNHIGHLRTTRKERRKMSNNNKKNVVRNRNASIRSREDRRGNLRTETYRRDDMSISLAITTDPRNDSTRVFIDAPDGVSYRFDGRTARTLYRALQKHYQYTEKSW